MKYAQLLALVLFCSFKVHSQDLFHLDSVTKVLDLTLNEASQQMSEAGILLKDIKITLSTTYATVNDGSVSLFVKGGYKHESGVTIKTTHTYINPIFMIEELALNQEKSFLKGRWPRRKRKIVIPPSVRLETALSDQITQAARIFDTPGPGGTVRQTVEISAHFSIKKTGKFGIGLEIEGFGFDYDGSRSEKETHEIKLTLTKDPSL